MIIHMIPGQGSQKQGMGKHIFPMFPQYCEQASTTLGYDIVELCEHDPNHRLNQTMFTQPAMYVVCALSFLNERENPDLLVGHSLGIYPALFAAKAISFEQGLKLVAKRAELFSKLDQGAMMAVLGKDLQDLDKILLEEGFYDIDVANYNSQQQIVLSGMEDRLRELQPLLEQRGYRCTQLPVNGAFHSRYMQSICTEFFEFLASEHFQEPAIPLLSSTNGNQVTASHLIEELAYQIVKPVRWMQVIRYLKETYPDAHYKEIGPGAVLTNLNQQIQPITANAVS